MKKKRLTNLKQGQRVATPHKFVRLEQISVSLRAETVATPPLTPTLSPEYRGEGANQRIMLRLRSSNL